MTQLPKQPQYLDCQRHADGKKSAFQKTTLRSFFTALQPAQPKAIYLRDGEVVLYRRSRRLLCRYRLADGSWVRQTTGKAALEHAIARARGKCHTGKSLLPEALIMLQFRHRPNFNVDRLNLIVNLAWRAMLTCFLLLSFPMSSHATEEPDFKIVQAIGNIEVREYTAYSVAEVVVPGPAEEAGNRAFPILAGYIFGKNKGERKFAMTAPVTQSPTPVKLEMTAPVTQSAAPGGFLVQFVLPKGVTSDNAPEPVDPRVILRNIAPSRMAVIRYSGFWSDANYLDHLQQLRATLAANGLQPKGEPVYSRYNAPFTPWFMRRNEIWLYLASAQ